MHSLAWVKENFISINSLSASIPRWHLFTLFFYRQLTFCGVRVSLLFDDYEVTSRPTVVVYQHFCSRDKLMSLPAEHLLLLSNTFGVEMNLWVFFGPRPVRFGQGHERLCNIAKPVLCSYFNECCSTLMTRPPQNCECRDVFFWPLED